MDDFPCRAPCWQTITPGVTDETSAMTILSNPDLVILDSFKCQQDSKTSQLNGCLFRRISEEGGQISFRDGIVRELTLKTDYLTLDEVIRAFGPPDYLMNLQGSQNKPEGKCYRAGLYYLEGMYFNISGCESMDFEKDIVHDDNLLLFEEMQIINVNFFMPDDNLEASLLNLFNRLEADIEIETLKTWEGYGYYSLVN